MVVYRSYGVPMPQIQSGTRNKGVVAGTISFPSAFGGTPEIILSNLGGTTALGRAQPLRVVSRFSGSFTYRASGSGGTIGWVAMRHPDGWRRAP